MKPEAFEDLLATYRAQREQIEAARALPIIGAERALAKLEEMRKQALIARMTSNQRTQLEAEFSLIERALRAHMEN